MASPILEVEDLTVLRDNDSPLFSNLSLKLSQGEVLVLKGVSGSGKSTLLKCIAELNLYEKGGNIKLYGKSSKEWDIPNWRIKIAYVPQRPSLLPGTPLDFLTTIQNLNARQKISKDSKEDVKRIDALDLAQEWGIEKTLWRRDWGTLSGGESQRIALSIAASIGGADILLLDEPTSALDPESSKKVEESLLSMLPPVQGQTTLHNGIQRKGTGPKALIWITHSAEQAERVGTRTLDLSRH
ncbi:uncharacterized protein I206_100545 [Kwoniella pini CBS 10737]|uniref:ATP-binding cassette transporter n=1 Tax=Kwoniella pini CBS 10737 TaxID=1296096 RepID=A0A1B9ID68_9TREE|nr:ATP-binding cassette transporter [Kwoniella pini CBS 10737]OCF53476.1 ATP-binding cassette transporter [Kwoniella pini CBS 10737]